ncbi:glycosyltransferase family 4 protein, partial [Parapusillimonas sp. SGNA-6]|nr:glycosyltransferase family 4 protein [Parapusillimonas sp. SGNA-6]
DAKRYFLNNTGLGNYSRDLIRMLEVHYPEHTYIKYTPKFAQPQVEGDDVFGQDRLPRTKTSLLFPRLWRRQWIVNDLKRDKIDIYHGLSGEIPIGLEKARIKSVVTIHDLIFLRFPELYKLVDRIIYDKKFKYAVRHADKIVAISQQTKEDIVQFYDIPKQKIEVIYQGCHPAFKTVKTEADKAAIRKKYNFPKNFILNVGSIEPRKNAFQLVKAVENMDIPLVIIGKETKYAQEIHQYIQQKGLQNKVYILQGFTMGELATIYAMADIFVYPSKYEGFGIPIIEALYAGTPVITNGTGVFPEAGGPFSCYVDPENIEELSQAIGTVLSDSDLRRKMSEQGRIYAQRFNDDVLARQWIELYQSV